MIRNDILNRIEFGLKTIYDSDTFKVNYLPIPTNEFFVDNIRKPNLIESTGDVQYLFYYGFEIIDKRAGKIIYLDGWLAEIFQQQVSHWKEENPTEEEVDEILESYTNITNISSNMH